MVRQTDLSKSFFVQERFSADEVNAIVNECVDNIIGENSYSNEKASLWSSLIAASCVANLNKLDKPYKYTCKFSIIVCVHQEDEWQSHPHYYLTYLI